MNCDLSVEFIHHLRLPLIRPRMLFIGAGLRIGAGLIGGRRIGAGRIGLGLAIGRGLGLDILIGAGLIGAGRIGAGLDGRIGCGLGLIGRITTPLGGGPGRFIVGCGRFTGVPGAFPALDAV